MSLDPVLKQNTPRPSQLANWSEVFAVSIVRTNGWSVGSNGAKGYVAIRNLPAARENLGNFILFGLSSQVTIPYGAVMVRATAYDFGLELAKPKVAK